MTHLRTQIRNKVAEMVTGLSTTGSRVFTSRVHPLQGSDLPGLCIWTRSEEISDEEGRVEGVQQRTVIIDVVGYEQLKNGLDDTLDKIAEEVEIAIFADRFLGNLVAALDLVDTNIELIAEEIEQPVGEITMTFQATYLVQEGWPATVA
jgi:hypothetical protein